MQRNRPVAGLDGTGGAMGMLIVGSRDSDGWEMKVSGQNGFERSYTLAGNAEEHQPVVIGPCF